MGMFFYLGGINKELNETILEDIKSRGLTVTSYYKDAYNINIKEGEGAKLLEELMNKYPTSNFSGSFDYQCEDRDSTFWTTSSYSVAVDKNGNRFLERESTTNWH